LGIRAILTILSHYDWVMGDIGHCLLKVVFDYSFDLVVRIGADRSSFSVQKHNWALCQEMLDDR
jgi:hypothetical protein